ncbi:hypothetical protein EVAR_88925_1 [Eumeta japonica]|uniref:MADF domain-containing protein n=1 Tax=Eumeta variegata TaxID=151549 RepID=A0A4C1VSR9_EUMVA|nr:hypothetical protein EVAR_88925_1 [Eumeta japonica]
MNEKTDAWREISSKFNIPVKEIKKKVNSLLGSYRREKSREKKSFVTGSGADDIYSSKWFAYTWFEFLKNKNIPNVTTDTMSQNVQEEIEVANSCTDVSITVTDTISTDVITTSIAQSTNNSSPVSTTATQPVSNRTISSRKRRAAEKKKQQAMLEGAYNLLKRTSEPADDALVVFGNHVANELRKYDSQTLPYVKKAILDILFQADTGQFPRRGYYAADYYSSPSSNSTVTINISTPPSQSLLSTEPSKTVQLVQSPLRSTPYPETINSLENTDLECFDM